MTDEVEPSERGHASIGEVLELLRAEFPDVTISKIRFLESQGLIEPERTASGYRKFYPPDVERLRWILRQQKDHYLPLRVIRGQLDDAHNPAADGTVSPSADGRRDAVEVAPVIRHPSAAIRVVTESVERRDLPSHARADRTSAVEFLRSGPTRDQSSSAIDAAPEAAPSAPFSPPPPPALMGVSMTLDELARASGLTLADIAQLEELGLVTARSVFSDRYYDEEALLACRLAAGFLSHGVETRHLRMYKTAAEREAAFFEQVVTPLLRRKDAESRATAVDVLADLGRLGEQLRGVALRQVLARLVQGAPWPPGVNRSGGSGSPQPRLGRMTDG